MKVLIVEDVYLIRNMLQHILISYGKFDFAEDGLEALDKFTYQLDNDDPYNLICLDILMPHIDGLGVLKKIRSIEEERNLDSTKKAKIVMVSALADQGMVMRCLKAGCDGFIAKPFTKDRIITEIQKLGLIEKAKSAQ